MSDPQKELEEFAYIVSHDLNAPLRHIKSFTALLMKKLGDKVGEEEQEYVHYIDNSVIKLETMLAALLDYSRIDTKSEKNTEFDCEALVKELIEEHQSNIEASKATIKTSDLPNALNANKQHIRMVFEHLLDNALKFKNPDTPPIIQISAEKQNDHYLFTIQDNGIGIPEIQHEHVFKMFKRLDPENYPGIGAGLTIAQKIIKYHGGNIWLDPENKTGTKIQFSLPNTGNI